MGDMQLKGSTGMFGKEIPVQARKVNDGVEPAKIEKAIQNNNLDEIVVKGQSGASYIVYADELSIKNGSLPKKGAQVNLPILPGEDGKNPATVTLVDDEFNEDYSFLTAGIVGALHNRKGGMAGDDTEINKIAHLVNQCEPADLDSMENEIKWAIALEKSGRDHTPAELKKYEEIFEKLNKQASKK
jgi:hypothetical protein